MTDHSLTEDRSRDLWGMNPYVFCTWDGMTSGEREDTLFAMRAAYAAGRDDALKPLDPLTNLTPGTVIRDAVIKGHGAIGDAFISTDTDGPCVATALDWYPLDALTEFTTDDLTIRYTRHGDTWITETLKDTDD